MIELTLGQIIISIILLWVSGITIGAVMAINLYTKDVEKQIIERVNKIVGNLKDNRRYSSK